MEINVRPVQDRSDLDVFARFPWQIYKGDPNWVPPLLQDRYSRIDLQKNPFWQTAERDIWIAWKGKQAVGTIAAIIDQRWNQVLKQAVGCFGFFECVQDQAAADRLFATAGSSLQQKGMAVMRGPFNPSGTDEIGILVEGFETRPAILEAHTPPYYPSLFEKAGFTKYNDTVARLALIEPDKVDFEHGFPEKMLRVGERVSQRPDLALRKVNMKDWDNELRLACRMYNEALTPLPDFIPLSDEEFMIFANSFKPIIDPEMALIAEVGSRPVGFAIALPDVNEALMHVDGRLNLPGLAKLWWYSRKIKRVSFKILIVIPDYQRRGIEGLLTMKIGQAIWKKGYQEVDMSMTGEENESSTTMQEHLGFKIYRRYRIYQKDLK
jgi:GNAT superfamily N-acetyltransferase